MNNLEKFLNRRIAEEEVMHAHARVVATESERANAERWLEECSTKRWILKFYRDAGHSSELTSTAVWATLTQVLLRMAMQWRDHADYQPAWATDMDVPETFQARMKRKAVEAR